MSRDAENQQGFGLGLALCKLIVEKMGGKIKVESVLGEGSTFTFVLPFHGTIGGMSTSRSRIPEPGPRTMVAHDNSNSENMRTVLVAEDEDSNYELVRVVLQTRFRLLRAHNGIEAVTMAEDEHPDLILMDIKMPEMDGLDATRIIKEINPDMPVIALSAHVYDTDIQNAMMSGCDFFLRKPFTVEELIETVEKYIEAAEH